MTTSHTTFTYWTSGFRYSACHGSINVVETPADLRDKLEVFPATGTYLVFQFFVRNAQPPEAPTPKLLVPYWPADAAGKVDETLLGTTDPRVFALVYLQQYGAKWAQYPFMYRDTRRNLLATLKSVPVGRPATWARIDRIGIDARFEGARGREWATDETVAAVRPIRNLVNAPVATRMRAVPKKPCGGTPTQLLANAGRIGRHVRAPVPAEKTNGLRADVTFRLEGAAPTTRLIGSGNDGLRTIAVSTEKRVPTTTVPATPEEDVPRKPPVVDRYVFQAFTHPYVCELVKQLHHYGLDGLLDPPADSPIEPLLRRQQKSDDYFEATHDPTERVATPYPVDEFDFERTGAYSVYNWELFFHIPVHIALRLAADQRYEQSLRWFHAVFDPMERPATEAPDTNRVWKIRPFFEAGRPDAIDDLVGLLSYGGEDEKLLRRKRDVELQIQDWRMRPFEPHRIARFRTSAYQRFVVMKYVQTLIAWGDQLFSRETLESINEGTQLYMLALRILGRRPERVQKPAADPPEVLSFRAMMTGELDSFSNVLIELESMVSAGTVVPARDEDGPLPPMGSSFVFCVPPNERMLGLWDLVEDRLFKIRHSMNIEGVVRQLPLFEPPIDPALLVRATALGLDLASVLGDVNAPPPVRRFRVLVQKAQEMCGELKSLSAALLSALEKKDGEELARIRQRQERDILEMTRAVREAQIREADETLAGLHKSHESAQARFAHYERLLTDGQLEEEDSQQEHLSWASALQLVAQGLSTTAGILAMFPTLVITTPAQSQHGGLHLSAAFQNAANASGAGGAAFQLLAMKAAYRASMVRRQEEWGLQVKLAGIELQQIERQIVAQEIRKQIAQHEQRIHERQIANAAESDEFLRNKYTNKELYDWMVGQLSALYFQAYKLTWDVAKRAERAFRHERAEPARAFVNFGAWESLRKGLLAGERLSFDLRRMEVAFMNEDKRDLELTRHVSLAELDPAALMELRESGRCRISIPETFYDADTPGHYLRRIRSVSLTMPAVAGPYVPVRSTLTLLSSDVRTAPNHDTSSLVTSNVAIQSIVTSHGRDDAGVFELDPREERYLPFEGAGAIARFDLELPTAFPAFDWSTIRDVVLTVRYTARDGGTTFRKLASERVEEELSTGPGWATTSEDPLALLISVRSDFPDQWSQLVSPPDGNPVSLTLPLTEDRFPFLFGGRDDVEILGADFIGVTTIDGGALTMTMSVPEAEPVVTGTAAAPDNVDFSPPVAPGAALELTVDLDASSNSSLVIGTDPKRLNELVFKDIIIIVRYKLGGT
jgi:hypothetical protein